VSCRAAWKRFRDSKQSSTKRGRNHWWSAHAKFALCDWLQVWLRKGNAGRRPDLDHRLAAREYFPKFREQSARIAGSYQRDGTVRALLALSQPASPCGRTRVRGVQERWAGFRTRDISGQPISSAILETLECHASDCGSDVEPLELPAHDFSRAGLGKISDNLNGTRNLVGGEFPPT
jgi:hypothetical protein